MTPASYRAGGTGATIVYTVVDSPLGALLVAATDRGLCKIDIGDDATALETALACEFHHAELERDDEALIALVTDVLARIEGRAPAGDLPIDVQGTAFQRRVWEELQRIPLGQTRTYGEVAAAIGAPRASRAVVVPCHRVVPATGGVGNYGLGPDRKRHLLEHEGAMPGDRPAASLSGA